MYLQDLHKLIPIFKIKIHIYVMLKNKTDKKIVL